MIASIREKLWEITTKLNELSLNDGNGAEFEINWNIFNYLFGFVKCERESNGSELLQRLS